ncbi:MAG: flagellar hook-basal body complex protein FliE [Syntrophomonadaceae bacterium]|nr:flagellar hook-basal body complex protein FliE [Syntrophomonadaceae bacterium]MDD3888804.1 flagellar hook-basal body complex protein FliE [Syntrophomonadaceae bacterium]MDD4548221.1 flagellar hook-basal body complex protein FliE [Syntrophomonadaceae bacterium]
MKLVPLESSITSINSNQDLATTKTESAGIQKGFANYLHDALEEVDSLQKGAQLSAQKLMTGGEEYLHNTILAYEKANLALQLTIEVRNKLLDAYQEIMRIQM